MTLIKNLDKKLALKPKVDKIPPQLMQIAQDQVLKFGAISKYGLMRKLKCSESMAKEICAVLRSAA